MLSSLSSTVSWTDLKRRGILRLMNILSTDQFHKLRIRWWPCDRERSSWSNNSLVDWLIFLMVGKLVGWLIERLNNRLIGRLTERLIYHETLFETAWLFSLKLNTIKFCLEIHLIKWQWSLGRHLILMPWNVLLMSLARDLWKKRCFKYSFGRNRSYLRAAVLLILWSYFRSIYGFRLRRVVTL